MLFDNIKPDYIKSILTFGATSNDTKFQDNKLQFEVQQKLVDTKHTFFHIISVF